MFTFLQTDADKLISAGDSAFKAHEAARRKLEKAAADETLYEEIENLGAKLLGFEQTISHDFPDDLRNARRAELERRLKAKIAERDARIVPLAALCAQHKQRLFKINSAIASQFSGYVGRVIEGLKADHPLRVELTAARKRIDATGYVGRTSEIVEIVKNLVDAVEADSTIPAPLFRFGALVEQALG
jgi:hypothetical protein